MSFGTTFTIPDQTKAQLQDTFLAAIQQTEAKFAMATNVDSEWTDQQYVLRMASTQNWQVNNARFGATNGQEFQAGFRSGFWQTLEAVPIKFDRGDQKLLANVALPTGRVITDMVSGLNRLKDDLFIAASTASALGGPKPYVTPQAFPSSNVIPVNYVMPQAALGGNSGMTIWKVLEARRRFIGAFVDFDREDMVLAMSSEEETQLLVNASTAPNAPWAKMVTEWFNARLGGNMEAKLCGFRVISSERLTVDSGTDIRTCVAFAKRAFCASPMTGVETKIDVLPEQRHAIQITGYANWGAFRVFDEMVQQIPCDRSP